MLRQEAMTDGKMGKKLGVAEGGWHAHVTVIEGTGRRQGPDYVVHGWPEKEGLDLFKVQ